MVYNRSVEYFSKNIKFQSFAITDFLKTQHLKNRYTLSLFLTSGANCHSKPYFQLEDYRILYSPFSLFRTYIQPYNCSLKNSRNNICYLLKIFFIVCQSICYTLIIFFR